VEPGWFGCSDGVVWVPIAIRPGLVPRFQCRWRAEQAFGRWGHLHHSEAQTGHRSSPRSPGASRPLRFMLAAERTRLLSGAWGRQRGRCWSYLRIQHGGRRVLRDRGDVL